MKKLIIYYPGIWAERLLTVERFKEVSYFITDDAAAVGRYAPLGSGSSKEVYLPEVLTEENKGEILILIADNVKYAAAKTVLEAMGFVANIDFFNGWKLNLNFYKQIELDSSWMEYEQRNDKSIANPNYALRTELMIGMIPEDVRSVMDIGCGVSFLKKLLSPNVQYYGVDICKREHTSFICDLNSEPLPDVNVDLYYMAGLLYYINDVDRLFSQMTKAKYILFDYDGTERYLRLDGVPGDPLISARNNFVSIEDMFNMLHRHGFELEEAQWNPEIGQTQWHFYLFKNRTYGSPRRDDAMS